LNSKVEELTSVTKEHDPAYLAQYYTQNVELIQKTCLADSEVPQLKEIPTSSVDLHALDHFLDAVKLNIGHIESMPTHEHVALRHPPYNAP
jgi:hypothetical protein